MNTKATILLLISTLFMSAFSSERVKLTTNYGDIIIELNREKAPITVENFLAYVDDAFYDGTVFHRVIKSFMIQAGGMTENLQQKSTNAPITNEADNGLSNLRGTIAMGRTTSAHSATSHFFINTVNNTFLDHKNKNSGSSWGYCVFGEVVEGMDVVDAIEAVQTTTKSGMQDVPVSSVIIEKAERVQQEAISKVQDHMKNRISFQKKHNLICITTESKAMLSITNLQGKRLQNNIPLQSGSNNIALKELPSGMYLYSIKNENGACISDRFIVQ